MNLPQAPREGRFDRPFGRRGLVGVAVLQVSLYASSWLIPYAGPWPVQPFDALEELVGAATMLLWLAATLVAISASPTVRLGWLLVLISITDHVWELGFIQVPALYYLADAFGPGISSIVLAHIVVAFPTGRLVDRLDRLLVRAIYVYFFGFGTLRLVRFEPNYACDPYCPRNPFAIWPDEAFIEALDRVTPFVVPVVGLLVIAAVVRHWRRSSAVRRRALVPVLVALPAALAVNTAFFFALSYDLGPVLDAVATPLVQASSMLLPGAFLIGVLRSRFARAGVADLALELGRGVPLGGLRAVLARTLRDPTLELAFAAPGGSGLVDPEGREFQAPTDPGRMVTPLERDGELLAVLVHDPAVDTENPGLVEAVASVARLSLSNERLSAQVRAQLEEVRESRQRIVEAADDERRRVERDLHDGAQQRLVALAMRLQLARDTTAGAQSLLDEATAELRAAIAEVRDLARGLHPTILTEAGLGAAIEALAERTPVPIRLDIPETRFPAPIEATAYFVVAEALTNVVRYAGANEARVTAAIETDRLIVTIEDDGVGGADPVRGSGLRGLADRVGAARGLLSVTSPVGAGTVIRADLPLT
jgi:signal transduction histidine kinase